MERKCAEEVVRLQADRYATILSTSSDGFWVFDPTGQLLDVNDAYCRMSGYTRQELLRLNIADLEAIEKPEDVARHIREVTHTGFDRFETQHRRKDGSIFDVEISVSFWPVTSQFLLFARDITAQRRSREELRRTSLYARNLIEASLDPLVTISKDGRIMDVNRATESVTGRAREQLIGSDFSDYFTEPENARQGYQQVFAQGLVQDYPLAIRHVSGRVTDVLYNAAVFRDESGTVEGVFAAARDVTERNRAQEEVRRASLYARTLIEASLDPLVTISKDGRIMDVNHATELVTGRTRGQLIGTDFSDYFTDPPKARQGYQQVFAQGLVQDYPLAIRNTSGHITEVLYNATLFRNEAGEVEGVFAAARDITERKKAEEALERYAKELERSNADLTDFASIASHDLQEPLRKVMAFGERLSEHCAGQLDAQGQDFLQRMCNAAQRMSNLIEALLQYSRLNTRAQPFAPVDLGAVLKEVLTDLEARIAESSAALEIGPMPRLQGDATQLRQLLQNLLSNALKFHRSDRVPHVTMNSRRTAGGWEIEVTDDGVGFDEKYLDRIFRPFQRLHGRGEFAGSGMGLAICRKIVSRHGGTITAHSAPEQGARFIVFLPEKAEEGRTE